MRFSSSYQQSTATIVVHLPKAKMMQLGTSSSKTERTQALKKPMTFRISTAPGKRQERKRSLKKTDEQDVTIGVVSGYELKVKKGSNLPIKVSNNIIAKALLAVAVEKHGRFNNADTVKFRQIT